MSEVAAAGTAASAPLIVGRYALFDEIAAGGMATVHLGRLLGAVGFGRTVAIKRLHAQYVKDQDFATMFTDEARIVARIRHPNVVSIVDVVQGSEGLFLVMEYVHGESLSRLLRASRRLEERVPPRVASSIMSGVLLGLHAAHETMGRDGKLLHLVHRDVSPQNVIVGADGVARVLDFGIAKAAGRAQITRDGQIKGKLAYMAPEQIRGDVDRRTDVFAAAVVLWEMLAGRRLHDDTSTDIEIVHRVVQGDFPRPGDVAPDIEPEVDAIVMRGLASEPNDRFASARELALELERAVGLASPTEVGEWVHHLAHEVLDHRGRLVAQMERAAADLAPSELPSSPSVVRIASGASPALRTGDPNKSGQAFPALTHTQWLVRRPRPWTSREKAIVAMCGVLAVLGVSLGTYAFARHQQLAFASPTMRSPRLVASGTTEGGMRGEPPSASTSWPVPLATRDAATRGALPDSGSPQPVRSAFSRPHPPPPPRPLPPARPKPVCDPPYTVDELGHRHYKPECMDME